MQADPDTIEGDEGEVVVPDKDVPRGETLLVKEYLARPRTQSLSAKEKKGGARGGARSHSGATKEKGGAGGGDAPPPPIMSSSPSPVPVLRAHPAADPAPSTRPVTPQSFRSHSSMAIHTSTTAGKWSSHATRHNDLSLYTASQLAARKIVSASHSPNC